MPLPGWDPLQSVDPDTFFFPDIDPALLDQLYPMYDLWAVGMPPVGPNFVAAALALAGDTKPPKGFEKKDFIPDEQCRQYKFIKWLKALYRAALYKHTVSTKQGFSLGVQVPGQDKPVSVTFNPGSWLGEQATGPQPSRIMVIGKNPGFEEMGSGRNFSGPTSQELHRALDELGVTEEDRAQWYATNVLRYPNPDARNRQSISATWIKDCMPLLHQELRLVHPDYVLLLGDDAVKAVLGRANNTANTNGRVISLAIPRHETVDEPPITHVAKVMTCMHPARVARQPDLYPQFLGTLKLFVDLTNGIDVGKEETDLEHYQIYNEEQLLALLDLLKAKNATEFAVDCEWHGSHPTEPGAYLRTIQISWGIKTAAAIVVRDCRGKVFDGEYRTHLCSLLKSTPDRRVRLIGHNFRADLPWLLSVGIDLRPEFEAPIDDPNPDGVTSLYGWQKTATEGGFDTMLAVHAWQETYPLGLEACTAGLLGMARYDLKLEEWKVAHCKQLGIKKSDLDGYGQCPDEILHPYGLLDADATWRLYHELNKPGGLLDSDRYGNNCRLPFWISMRASPAFLEMEMTGVLLDKERAEELTQLYMDARNKKLAELRKALAWPEFNPNSSRHRCEMLFGEQYNANKVRSRPREDKGCLRLAPIKSTGRRSTMWSDLVKNKRTYGANPSTDKETLGILAATPGIPNEVKMLRDISFVSHLLRTVLRPPRTTTSGTAKVPAFQSKAFRIISIDTTEGPNSFNLPPSGFVETDSGGCASADTASELVGEDEDLELDENGDKIYDKGLISDIQSDGRIRTHYFQTKETARASSSRPPLQNLSKRREPDYERVLGDTYKYALRSILKASPGYVLLEADYTAAEVAAVAWLSGDEALIDHAYRSTLDEDDPNYFDIHSNIAVRAFQLSCLPTKRGLKSAGKIALRTAAKTVFFGYLYGQGAESAARKAREEGADVSSAEAQALINSLNKTYPCLSDYFKSCKERVSEPGWVRNCFGRYRRFLATTDRKVLGELERQSSNFGIQSAIADAVSRALDHLYTYRNTYNLDYKILLQIHDAVILEVAIKDLELVYDDVIPLCMSSLVDIWPCFPDGTRKPGITKPYHLSTGRDVYLHWGEEIPLAVGKELGIPERFCSDE